MSLAIYIFNASFSTVRHLRDVAHYWALKYGSTSDWASYRRLCNKVNAMLQSAKAEYFSNIVSSLIGLSRSSFGNIFNLCPDTLDLCMVE